MNNYPPGELFASNLFVHGRGVVLADGFGYLQNLHGHRAGAHGDLDFIAHLYIVAGLGGSAVDADAGIVAGLVGHRPALDEAGDLQVFVQAHLTC